jgi:nucleotide-binding universal stress UspA family protein
MKILLAADGSDHTKRMLGYVAAHDELFGRAPAYTAVTAITPVPPNAARHIDRQTLTDYYAEQAEHVFKPIRAFAQQNGWKIETKHVLANPADAIADLAEREKFDMVVMGSHGHTSLANVLLGSVATGVLARCKVPVLLIR